MQTQTSINQRPVWRESAKPDPIQILSADHERIENLLHQLLATDKGSRQHVLAKMMCRELSIHMAIEEELLYPAARAALGSQDLLDQATVEHAALRDLLHQVEYGKPDDVLWTAKVKVLLDYLEHHIEEEHAELFPQIESSNIDLVTLGEQMWARRQELEEQEALPL